jgi:hypothetical protein
MANVNFDYRPFRVFVVPRAGLGEVIRHFRVGSYYEDEDAYIDQVAERVVAADRIVPLTVTHAYLSSVSLVFIDSATEEQCRELQELFPFEREGDMSLGLEAYLSDWSPERGPWFLAEWFHRDQRIDLWWD